MARRSSSSRSQSRSESAAPGFDLNNPTIAGAVIFVLAVLFAIACQGNNDSVASGTFNLNVLSDGLANIPNAGVSTIDTVGNFYSGAKNDSEETDLVKGWWPFSLVLTMHLLYSVQNAGEGWWLGSFFNALLGAFAIEVVPNVFNGDPWFTSINKEEIVLAFFLWFICNREVGGTNVWNTFIKALGVFGSVLEGFASICSTGYMYSKLFNALPSGSSAMNLFGAQGENFCGDGAMCTWWNMLNTVDFTLLISLVLIAGARGFFPLGEGFNMANYQSTFDSAIMVFLLNCVGHFHKEALISGVSNNNLFFFGLIVVQCFGHLIPVNPREMFANLWNYIPL